MKNTILTSKTTQTVAGSALVSTGAVYSLLDWWTAQGGPIWPEPVTPVVAPVIAAALTAGVSRLIARLRGK